MSTEEFSSTLGVSTETIRRDLAVLERRGLLVRVRGGAAVSRGVISSEEASFEERTDTSRAAKDRIGAAAARLIEPGQTVAIDIGTTALAVARAIPIDFSCTVVTPSLLAAHELADRHNIDVLVCGGRMRSGDLALSGAAAIDFFENVNPDIAFLGSGGVDPVAGLTDYYFDEADLRRRIIANAKKSYVLAHSEKFGRVTRYRVADLAEITGVITEAEPHPEVREWLIEHRIETVLG